MGLDASSASSIRLYMGNVRTQADYSEQSISDYKKQQQNNMETQYTLEGDLAQAIKNIADETDTIAQLSQDIISTNEKRVADLDAATIEAMSKMISLNKFVDQSGMCGMGMGMGNTYSCEGAISLTVEEVLALSTILPDPGDSQDTMSGNFCIVASELNKMLAESGSSATYGDENGVGFVQIKRANGTCVKIYDANGNGALDVKDYDFCSAIQQAKAAVEQLERVKESINTTADNKISELESSKQTHTELKEGYEAKKDELKTVDIPKNENKISTTDEKITDETKAYNDLIAKYDKLNSDYKEALAKENNPDNESASTLTTTGNIVAQAASNPGTSSVSIIPSYGSTSTSTLALNNNQPIIIEEEDTPAKVA